MITTTLVVVGFLALSVVVIAVAVVVVVLRKRRSSPGNRCLSARVCIVFNPLKGRDVNWLHLAIQI